MVPNLTDWTVVTVGQWNPNIFSSQWINSQLHIANVETLLSVGQAIGIDVRYQTPNLILIPSRDRLITAARNVEEESLRQMEQTHRAVLRLLLHTPVRAVGINFGFIESEPPPDIIQTFNLHDNGALSDAGLVVGSTEIIRKIEIAPWTLKLKTVLDGGVVRFHFNFTQEVTSAEQAAGLVDGALLPCRDRAMGMLTTIFQLHRQEVT